MNATSCLITDGSSAIKHTRRSAIRWIRQPIGRWLDRLFMDEDANAIAHGWDIQRLPHGGRRYRDPRWDTVREARAAHAANARTEIRP
jgi:hypothetical protein